MRVLITGASGKLGREVAKYFPDASAPHHKEMNILSVDEVAETFRTSRPDLVIHLAALADVRKCEESKTDAWNVNVVGTSNIAKTCSEATNHPLLLYPSTPCVFRCDKGNYLESSRPDPINYYGRTKAAAEKIALAYDNSLVFRKNFVPRARWRYQGAFSDRYGTYLFADELAYVIAQLPSSGLRGVVHIAGEERLSMLELARITTPEVEEITLGTTDLTLSPDMSLGSERIRRFPITRSPERPPEYRRYALVPLGESHS